MLHSLHIRNYILLDSVDIEFPEGLVIVTGQTGAGKSIFLGALSFLAGAKADATMISPGADSCVVEAEFTSDDPAVGDILREADIDANPDGRLIIRRVIAASGRSRSFINDCPVQQSMLQALSLRLVDIHSQHKSLLLTDRNFQLSVLDSYAGNAATLAECRRLWKELTATRSAIAAMRARLAESRREKDYNDEQFRRLSEAKLVSGELEELEEEQKALANAEEIKGALGEAAELLDSSDEDAPVMGAARALRQAAHRLEGVAAYLQAVPELVQRLESARIEIDDVRQALEDLDSRTEVSPSRLEAVEERMSLIYSLFRRYGCTTVDELIALRDEYSDKLFDSDSLSEQIAGFEKKEAEILEAWKSRCAELTAARKKAAPAMAAEIEQSLRFLELENADFELKLVPVEGGPDGMEQVQYLFSSTGARPMELSKVASGGEISRIMLSLKAVMARMAGMPTMVFDEIDTGVSGSVADKMGRMICTMGESMQVFSITHLPQVAAKGRAHYVVSKERMSDGRTVSNVLRVDGEKRVMEIARLLSGERISDAAVANARALLAG